MYWLFSQRRNKEKNILLSTPIHSAMFNTHKHTPTVGLLNLMETPPCLLSTYIHLHSQQFGFYMPHWVYRLVIRFYWVADGVLSLQSLTRTPTHTLTHIYIETYIHDVYFAARCLLSFHLHSAVIIIRYYFYY